VTRATRLGHEGPALAVLAVGLAGVVVATALHHWRAGLYVVAAALLLGAVLRLVLPARQVGSLAVRAKPVDVATLLVLGVALALLAGAVAP
jgi:hypothetical protein